MYFAKLLVEKKKGGYKLILNKLKKPVLVNEMNQYHYVLRPITGKGLKITYQVHEMPVSKDKEVLDKDLLEVKMLQYADMHLSTNIMYKMMIRFLLDYYILGSITTVTGGTIQVNKTLTDLCIGNNLEINDYLMVTDSLKLLTKLKQDLGITEDIESFTIVVSNRSLEHNNNDFTELDLFSDNLEFTNKALLTSNSKYIKDLKRKTLMYLKYILNDA